MLYMICTAEPLQDRLDEGSMDEFGNPLLGPNCLIYISPDEAVESARSYTEEVGERAWVLEIPEGLRTGPPTVYWPVACAECGKDFTRDEIVEEKLADGETTAACEECRALTEKEIWQTE